MPTQTKSKTIGGHNVSVTTHPALRANALKVRLIKLLGVSLANLLFKTIVKAQTGKLSLKDLLAEDFSVIDLPSAVEALCDRIDPADYNNLVLEIMALTTIDSTDVSKEENFNEMFAGNFLFMYKVIGYVLEVNFGDFLALIPTTPAKPKVGTKKTQEK
jgi:hypothetical protein